MLQAMVGVSFAVLALISTNLADIGALAQSFNACDPNPCYNGGECEVIGSSFECKCPPYTLGSRCQYIGCVITGCANGGTCSQVSTPAGICLCPPGWGGYSCEDLL
ncbi:delta-like protein 3 [Ostrea edulis]|uniref:delta-like protein 3 n=1 Tax=Ostrea edulis TaxID=37623 RepID=UPI002095CF27|nr:delta-like protein 3 [Ostrea edulis]